MRKGIFVNGRVRLLLKKGSPCYRGHRDGERRRKSVRGSIVGPDMSVLSLQIVKKGDGELPGLTDKVFPIKFGPKRASKIRKLFNLSKSDDVTKYVIRRKKIKKGKEGKPDRVYTVKPTIQRLVTPRVLREKKQRYLAKKLRQEKSRAELLAYHSILAARETKRTALAEVKKKLLRKKLEAEKERIRRAAALKRAARLKRLAQLTAKKAAALAPKKDAPKKDAPKKGAKSVQKPAKPTGKNPAKPAAAKKPAKPAAQAAKKPAGEKPAKPVSKAAPKKPAAPKPKKAPAKQ